MHQQLVLNKITSILAATDGSYDQKLTAMLDEAKRVFVAGAGRSGLVTKFFAMRLLHTGYDVSVVGEIVTPSIQAGDLLIIISGSGETEQLVAFTKKAQDVGAKIMLICSRAESTIGNMAEGVFHIGNDELYQKTKGMPMGTMFELSTLIFLESTVSHIVHEKGLTEEGMRGVHANLE